MSMPSLGDNVVSDGTSILMFSQIRKKTRKKQDHPSVTDCFPVSQVHPVGKNVDCAALWCVIAHICVLVSVVAAVNDHKANTTLTGLRLDNNKVADAGATALAEALKATVCRFISSWSRHVLLMTTGVTSQSGMKSWRRQVALQFVCTASVLFVS